MRITKGPTPEIPTEYSVGIRMLGKELLDRDPSRRPPAAEVLKKPVVQEVVRKMLDEVKAEEDAAAPPADAPPRAGAPAAAEAGGSAPSGAKYVRDAGSYRKNEVVEYYSETHKEWLPASITNVDAEGRIMLNVKPNVWLSLDVQGSKVRPKQGADQGQPQVGFL
ncbi:unnamed protein product [Prorocentrum cordatum]|uniref:non-specific serine/threonine protein kinase n=1 Tax=Prorocentrum cordatum TaxID=2364126 RepID=A0ABN9U748_9DINO|nr:unnamed protein product [Polarella glacialis]